MISFLVLTLGFVCSSFSSSFRCKVRLFIWDFSFVFLNLFIYLFLATLGLCCCTRALFSCSEWGLLFVVVRGLHIVVASLGTRASVVVARGLSSCGSRALEHRLSSCGTQALLLHGMWDLPRPGLEPVSPALAGRFLTTVPPRKSQDFSFFLR